MNHFADLFRDPNEPQITDDRIFHQDGITHFIVIFKRCNHFLNIPWSVIANMSSTYETVDYINKLECRTCSDRFRDMEVQLNNEVNEFIKNGGKL